MSLEVKKPDRWLALIVRTILLGLFFWTVKGLLMPIILGALFALILYPLEKKITPRLGKAARYAPAIVTAGALLLVVLPFTLIAIKAISSINQFITQDWGPTVERAQRFITEKAANYSTYTERFHITPENIRTNVENLARTVGGALAGWFGGVAKALPGYIIDVFLFVLALYYFLRDGRSLTKWLLKLSPFPHVETEELFTSIHGTVNGAILGVLVTAAVQGALTMASLYIFGVPGAFLLGIVATILAVIPMLGTTPVTGGATIFLFVTGRFGAGIGMLVMAVLIGLADNIVRPWVQSSRGTMHPLIALLAIFGGIELFGAAGIFVGPVVAAMALWIVDTYADLRLKQTLRESMLPPSSVRPSVRPDGPGSSPVSAPPAVEVTRKA